MVYVKEYSQNYSFKSETTGYIIIIKITTRPAYHMVKTRKMHYGFEHFHLSCTQTTPHGDSKDLSGIFVPSNILITTAINKENLSTDNQCL